jgi:hypothetical protein
MPHERDRVPRPPSDKKPIPGHQPQSQPRNASRYDRDGAPQAKRSSARIAEFQLSLVGRVPSRGIGHAYSNNL